MGGLIQTIRFLVIEGWLYVCVRLWMVSSFTSAIAVRFKFSDRDLMRVRLAGISLDGGWYDEPSQANVVEYV